MPARTIDEVVKMLELVTERAIHDRSRIGFFSALYLRMTLAVRRGVLSKEFTDPESMERFDVIFANRYFDALEGHRNGRVISAVWQTAFDACRSGDLIVLQHLYLGLTAHLLLDLAISAAETSPGAKIFALEHDFKKINAVVESLMRDVHVDLGQISPWMSALDRTAGDLWASSSRWVTYFVRGRAWGAAIDLAHSEAERRAEKLRELEAESAWMAKQVAKPPLALRATVALVRARESRDVRRIIPLLRGSLPQNA
jgi:hypothetical protein